MGIEQIRRAHTYMAMYIYIDNIDYVKCIRDIYIYVYLNYIMNNAIDFIIFDVDL